MRVADMVERVAVPSRRLRWICTEQTERNATPQRVPQVLEVDGTDNVPALPQQRHHLAVGPDPASALARPSEEVADGGVERRDVRTIIEHERRQSLRRVEDHEASAARSSF